MQLHLDKLHTRVMSLESWILQIMVWVIITWQTSTIRDHGSHCLSWHRTVSLTYMSDQTSEGGSLRGYMWRCLRHTERRGIRTATNYNWILIGMGPETKIETPQVPPKINVFFGILFILYRLLHNETYLSRVLRWSSHANGTWEKGTVSVTRI